jgi:hypothetical protein
MDIFDPSNVNSLTRKLIGSKLISLEELPKYHIPDNYNIVDFHVSHRNQIDSIADDIAESSIRNGYSKNITRDIYEAILNAYQHGNKKDPSKIVRIGWNDNASFNILDEGKFIRSELIPYILALREGHDIASFYAFSGLERNIENFGVGIRNMHIQFNVNFYHGELGGLAVLLNHKYKNV